MLQFLFGLFILLHGLVHLWYFTISQRLVEFQADMGWTGRSWILSNFLQESATRLVASGLYLLAAAAFVASSIGIFMRSEWWQAALGVSAVFSSLVLVLFWDGSAQMLVQKGVLGLAINIGILLALFLL